jgi:hypothetical protein
MFVLAFESSNPVGMGIIQYNAEHKLPEDKMMEDLNKENKLYGDYVGGRMMKLQIQVTEDSVLLPDEFSVGYNSFMSVYPTPLDLFNTANETLDNPGEVPCK